jgi:hypothetical protein
MKPRYRHRKLTRHEEEMFMMFLIEELEMQAWYAISFSELLGAELFVFLQ